MLVAIVASMLVVFARMSTAPHGDARAGSPTRPATATSNASRKRRPPRASRSSASTPHCRSSTPNSVKRLHRRDRRLAHGRTAGALVVDCTGINDIDATGADALLGDHHRARRDAASRSTCATPRGRPATSCHRAGLWDRLDGRIHATAHLAVEHIRGNVDSPETLRGAGIDERHPSEEPDLAAPPEPATTEPATTNQHANV